MKNLRPIERIERLERMVKTLAETVHSLTTVINTGSYEYSLAEIRIELANVKEFEAPEEKDPLAWAEGV